MKQIYIWNPMTTGFIMQTLIYILSMAFLSSLSRRRSQEKRLYSQATFNYHTRTKLNVTKIFIFFTWDRDYLLAYFFFTEDVLS